MPQHFLFPNKFKLIGCILLVPGIIAGLYLTITDVEPGWLYGRMLSIFPSEFYGTKKAFSIISVNFAGTLAGVFSIIGGLMVGFSKDIFPPVQEASGS